MGGARLHPPSRKSRAFLVRTFGRGRTGKELLEACRRVSSRTNGFVQASSLIAIVVNADASSGNKGPLLADFLSSLWIGASHVRQSDEDWVVLFDPRLVRSVHRLTPADVNSAGSCSEIDRSKASSMKPAAVDLYRWEDGSLFQWTQALTSSGPARNGRNKWSSSLLAHTDIDGWCTWGMPPSSDFLEDAKTHLRSCFGFRLCVGGLRHLQQQGLPDAYTCRKQPDRSWISSRRHL